MPGQTVQQEKYFDFQRLAPFRDVDGIDQGEAAEEPGQTGSQIGVHQMGMNHIGRFFPDDPEQREKFPGAENRKIQKIRIDPQLIQTIDNGSFFSLRFFLQGNHCCGMTGFQKIPDRFQYDLFRPARV